MGYSERLNTVDFNKWRCTNTVDAGKQVNTVGYGHYYMPICVTGLFDGYTVYIPTWESLAENNYDLNTSNSISLVLANQNYTLLDNSVTLSGDFLIETYAAGGINYFLAKSDDELNWARITVSNSAPLRIRIGGFTHDFTHIFSNTDLFKLRYERIGTDINLYIDDVFIESVADLSSGADFVYDNFGKRLNVYSTGEIAWIHIKDSTQEFEYQFTEGEGLIVNDLQGLNKGVFSTNITELPVWNTGVHVPFDLTTTEEIGYNAYDNFGDATSLLFPSISSPVGDTIEISFVYPTSFIDDMYLYNNGDDFDDSLSLYIDSSGDIGGNKRITGGLDSTFGLSSTLFTAGDIINLKAVIISQDVWTLEINGVLVTTASTLSQRTIRDIERIGSSTASKRFEGVIINFIKNGVDYNSFNDWNGLTKTGTFTIKASNDVGVGYDEYGTPILGSNTYDEGNGVDAQVTVPTLTMSPTSQISASWVDTDNIGTIVSSRDVTPYIFIIRNDAASIEITTFNGSARRYVVNRTWDLGSVVEVSINGLGASEIITVNGVVRVMSNTTITGTNTGFYIFSKGGLGEHWNGIVVNLTVDGTSYNTFNNWNGGTKAGTFTDTITSENISGSGIDYYGIPIQTNLIANILTKYPINTQTALMSHNRYGHFASSNHVEVANSVSVLNTTFKAGVILESSALQVIYENYDDVEQLGIAIYTTGLEILVSAYNNVTGIVSSYVKSIPFSIGEYLEIETTYVAGDKCLLSVNGVAYTIAGGGYAGDGTSKQTIGNRMNASLDFIGVITYIESDSVYGLMNDWGAATYNNKPDTIVIPEDPNNLGYDLIGEAILLPVLADGFNMTGQDNHRLDTEIIDRTNQMDVGIFLEDTAQSYIDFGTILTYVDDFEITTIMPIGGYAVSYTGSTLSWIQVQATIVRVRLGGGTIFSLTSDIPVENEIIKVERVSGTLNLYINGVLKDTILAVPGGLTINNIGNRANSLFDTGVITYLNINNEHEYEFDERTGLTITDKIGSLDGTFATLLATLPEWQMSSNGSTWITDDGSDLVGGTDGIWIRPETNDGSEVFFGDDTTVLQTNASKFLEVIYNGVTLTTTQALMMDTWYYVNFVTNGLGLGYIYIGTETTDPVLSIWGKVGESTVPTTIFTVGNDNTLLQSENGYWSQYSYHPLQLTLENVVYDYEITKPKIEGILPIAGLPLYNFSQTGGTYLTYL